MGNAIGFVTQGPPLDVLVKTPSALDTSSGESGESVPCGGQRYAGTLWAWRFGADADTPSTVGAVPLSELSSRSVDDQVSVLLVLLSPTAVPKAAREQAQVPSSDELSPLSLRHELLHCKSVFSPRGLSRSLDGDGSDSESDTNNNSDSESDTNNNNSDSDTDSSASSSSSSSSSSDDDEDPPSSSATSSAPSSPAVGRSSSYTGGAYCGGSQKKRQRHGGGSTVPLVHRAWVYVWHGQQASPAVREKAAASAEEIHAALNRDEGRLARQMQRSGLVETGAIPIKDVYTNDVPFGDRLALQCCLIGDIQRLYLSTPDSGLKDKDSSRRKRTGSGGMSHGGGGGGGSASSSSTNSSPHRMGGGNSHPMKSGNSSNSNSGGGGFQLPTLNLSGSGGRTPLGSGGGSGAGTPLMIKKLSLPVRGAAPSGSEASDQFDLNKVKEDKKAKIEYWDKQCSQITDTLYLGSQTVAMDREQLQRVGVTHVVNCAGAVCENYHEGHFVYRRLYLTDGETEDISTLLYDVNEWIDHAIETLGGKVFIHCQQGVSRSSAILIGYLMWKWGQNFNTVHQYVRERRGVSRPNAGFMCQLLTMGRRISPGRPLDELRIYAIVPQSKYDPDFLVAKVSDKAQFELRVRDACFIIQSALGFFLVVGSAADPRKPVAARKTIDRIIRFESVPAALSSITECVDDSSKTLAANSSYSTSSSMGSSLPPSLSALLK